MPDDLTPRPMHESRSTMTELMMPNMANNLGNVFGGVILSLIDRVAAVAAIRHARGACVTVSIDQVEFREPIHLGELVLAHACVVYVGRSSIDVGVRVEAEDLSSGVLRHTNSCYLTFVAIDREGHPRSIAPVVPQTDEERRWFAEAQERRRVRDRQKQ